MNIGSMADRHTLLSACCAELLRKRETQGCEQRTDVRLDNCLFVLRTEGPDSLWIGTPLENENRNGLASVDNP